MVTDNIADSSSVQPSITADVGRVLVGLIVSVNVNNMLMEWFDTSAGVKQGDILSPSMLGIFIINDIAVVSSVNTVM